MTSDQSREPADDLEPGIEAQLDTRLSEIIAGFVEAIDQEVETLRREGLPIYVADNGRIIDLQQADKRP